MNLTVSEIKKLLNKWHFYKAITLSSPKEELTRKINAVEKAIFTLEDIDQEIIRMKYFQAVDIELIQAQVFLSRSGVYYRINNALKELKYIIENTA